MTGTAVPFKSTVIFVFNLWLEFVIDLTKVVASEVLVVLVLMLYGVLHVTLKAQVPLVVSLGIAILVDTSLMVHFSVIVRLTGILADVVAA